MYMDIQCLLGGSLHLKASADRHLEVFLGFLPLLLQVFKEIIILKLHAYLIVLKSNEITELDESYFTWNFRAAS